MLELKPILIYLKLIKTGKEVDRLLRTSVLQTEPIKDKPNHFSKKVMSLKFLF